MLVTGGRDYYDKVLAFGYDSSPVFMRESQRWLSDADVPLSSVKLFTLVSKKHHPVLVDRSGERYSARSTAFTLRSVTVIFCGDVFGGISVQEEEGSLPNAYWQVKPFQGWLDTMGVRPLYRIGKPVVDMTRHFYRRSASPELRRWLTENGVVVAIRHAFVDETVTWRINSDSLKEVQFYKAVDAYSAHQMINMWLNNITQSEPQMVAVTDAVRIAKHGFDKRSFRNTK